MKINDENKCVETSSTLILYLYGEADDPASFEAHLDKCADCRAVLDGYRKALEAYRAEEAAVPRAIKAPASTSLWEKLADIFRIPLRQPALAGGLALAAAALVIWIAVRAPEQTPVTGEITSYSELESAMDSLDDSLDNMFAMNGYAEETNGYPQDYWPEDYETGDYDKLAGLLDELDEIESNIKTF